MNSAQNESIRNILLENESARPNILTLILETLSELEEISRKRIDSCFFSFFFPPKKVLFKFLNVDPGPQPSREKQFAASILHYSVNIAIGLNKSSTQQPIVAMKQFAVVNFIIFNNPT